MYVLVLLTPNWIFGVVLVPTNLRTMAMPQEKKTNMEKDEYIIHIIVLFHFSFLRYSGIKVCTGKKTWFFFVIIWNVNDHPLFLLSISIYTSFKCMILRYFLRVSLIKNSNLLLKLYIKTALNIGWKTRTNMQNRARSRWNHHTYYSTSTKQKISFLLEETVEKLLNGWMIFCIFQSVLL